MSEGSGVPVRAEMAERARLYGAKRPALVGLGFVGGGEDGEEGMLEGRVNPTGNIRVRSRQIPARQIDHPTTMSSSFTAFVGSMFSSQPVYNDAAPAPEAEPEAAEAPAEEKEEEAPAAEEEEEEEEPEDVRFASFSPTASH